MGLFDFLGGGLKKHAGRVANKRTYAPDRWESIQALGKMRSPESLRALFRRFAYTIDPSITDQEEKDEALRLILAAGQESLEPARAFLAEADSVTWPLKALESLTSESEIVELLLKLLSKMGTDYERDPERKIQVLGYLSDRRAPQIADAVLRFVEDMNETVRFHAINAALAQDPSSDPQAVDAMRAKLLKLFVTEESVRVRAAILDGFAQRGFSVGAEAAAVRPMLPERYALDKDGVPRRA